MRLWPAGTLRAVRKWCDRTETLLIADEVMTGFGLNWPDVRDRARSRNSGDIGLAKGLSWRLSSACYYFGIRKNILRFRRFRCLRARGLLMDTATPGTRLDAGRPRQASRFFKRESVLEALQPKIQHLSEALADLRQLPGVVEVRQCGFIAGNRAG